jgi:hypothetical protein
MIDWTLFLVGLALPTIGVLTWMWLDAERECKAQRIRAEEAETWLLLADEEAAALRRRLSAVERRNRTVRSLPMHRISGEQLEEMRN